MSKLIELHILLLYGFTCLTSSGQGACQKGKHCVQLQHQPTSACFLENDKREDLVTRNARMRQENGWGETALKITTRASHKDGKLPKSGDSRSCGHFGPRSNSQSGKIKGLVTLYH